MAGVKSGFWLDSVGGSLVDFKLAVENTPGLRKCKGDFENILIPRNGRSGGMTDKPADAPSHAKDFVNAKAKNIRTTGRKIAGTSHE